MRLELCIPVYNEEEIILNTLDVISNSLKKLPNDISWSIIVSDNGSVDKTVSKISDLNNPKIQLIHLDKKGKGNAIKVAALQSKADLFGFIDADLSANPDYIVSMVDVLVKNKTDVVIGSRLIDEENVDRSIARTITSKFFNILQYMLFKLNIKDTQCGLKMMNKAGLDILVLCKEETWFLDLEFLAFCKKKGVKVLEIPVSWTEFYYTFRKSKLRVFRDGFRAIISMFRIKIRLKKI